jgi:hypothetical protein
VRHFGYLSAAARRQYERVRTLLRAAAVAPATAAAPPAPACPCCGHPMTFLRCRRPARAPPLLLPPLT